MEDSVVQLQKTVEDVEGMEEETTCLTDVLISDNQSCFFFYPETTRSRNIPSSTPSALVWKCYYIASVKGDRHAIVKLPKISDLFVIHF